MKTMKLLSPTGIIGYGFPEDSLRAGLALKPDLIAADAGSTDPGPYYLGSGTPFTTATAVKRDLTLLIRAACELNIPLIVGSAGGSGGRPHLERETKIVLEIAKEHNLTFKLATISAELDKDFLVRQLMHGKISPVGVAPAIDYKDILDSTRVVAQMGIEPIISALDEGAQVVLCGRCYDPAVFAAPAVRAGFSKALATHLGKILECAAIAAVPGSGSDCMMGYLGEDYFMIEPLSPARRCTVISVAVHTLYEKSNPYLLPGPGGVLDVSGCTFTQQTERRVKVTGSKYVEDAKKTVKLEGARPIGYRTISICGNRDSVFISQIDTILEAVRARIAANLSGSDFEFHLDFIVYGKNGVMGEFEPNETTNSHEIGIIIDVVADTQEQANTVCSVARSTLLHHGYEGRLATAGNLAFPYSPSDIPVGAVYNFSVYSLLETDEPEKVFKRTHYNIAGGEVK
ncbi:MAG TPA: DUF1446 domain-containing protein [Firmicutes bacterium]|nr:DUF1446 domain-containing protein [Bacillota bacterium]